MRAGATFQARWDQAAIELKDHDFLVFESADGRVMRYSYGGMDGLVAAVAGGLAALGVGRGSAVHLVLSNSPAFVATWLACARLGAWMVPADPDASEAEIAHQVARISPVAGICTSARADAYRRSVALAGAATTVVAVDEDDTELSPLRGPAASANPVDPSTRLAVMFTSGTTATPKGVELTQGNYAFAGDVMAMASALSRHDRQLVVLPLFHANAQYYSFAAAISAGASVALVQAFSASGFMGHARRHNATHTSLFAAPIRMILARTPPDTAPLKLRHAWFAQNLSAAHYEQISHLLGCRPRQIYGMTETLPAVLSNPPVGSLERSIGVPTIGCHVRVMDATGQRARPGQVGSIQVGGHPGATLFLRYLDDPATTAAAIVERHDDGFVWFDTGDRATVDEDGFHYFDGRRSDTLKVGGENVSIGEVEHVIAEHPAVYEVAVIGVPDPLRDEVPHAFVVLSAHESTDVVDDIRRFTEERLAGPKRPRVYTVVDELPRTSVGKIRKFLLTPSGTDPAGEPNYNYTRSTEP